MKILTLMTLIFTSSTFAQSYSDFHNYWYSDKVVLKPSEKISDFSEKYDYKKDSRFNWLKAVMHMNGVVSRDLEVRSTNMEIFVPPKKSFAEYLAQFRDIASTDTRPYCEPISAQYLEKSFGSEFDLYSEYFKLITSRKVNLSKGDNLYSVISGDKYKHQNESAAVKQVMRSNGLVSESIVNDREIYLPYCANPIITQRDVASIATSDMIIDSKAIREPKTINYSVGLMYGTVENVQSSKELNMNVIKATVSSSYKINDDYTAKINGSIAKFTNVSYSESNRDIKADDNYFEFGFGIDRKYRDMTFGVSYDLLNYFVINGALAEPIVTHRVSAKFSKSINESFIFGSSLGYMTSFSDIEVSGVDLNVSVSYLFGKHKDYSATTFIYRSSVENKLSGDTDESTALGLAFAYRF